MKTMDSKKCHPDCKAVVDTFGYFLACRVCPKAKSLEFTLPIAPVGQQRPRFTKTGIAYKSKTQKDNERNLCNLLIPHVPVAPLDGAVKVEFVAYFPIPKSLPKKDKEILAKEETIVITKPDIDNLAKMLLDCMTQMRFLKDDCIVGSMKSEKIYSNNPRWEVKIEEIKR